MRVALARIKWANITSTRASVLERTIRLTVCKRKALYDGVGYLIAVTGA
jgi:hypothetical protein